MARERTTVRAVILDAAGSVLLQAVVDERIRRSPRAIAHEPVWLTPGGGVEPGETLAAALDREVREETGLTDVPWGPWVWRREVTLLFEGEERRFVEHYRVATLGTHAPTVAPAEPTAHERTAVRGHRWWSFVDLTAIGAPLFPPALPALLSALARDGWPAAPIDISAFG